MKQEELKDLFSAELEKHRGSSSESKFDAIADSLDVIVGWCSPHRAMYQD